MQRLAIISGGSRGLGAAFCAQYTSAGYTVIEFSRSAPHVFSVAVDLADAAAAMQIFKAALAPLAAQVWDEVVVLNNAATLDPMGPSYKKTSEQLIANINTNITSGVLFLSQSIAQFQQHAGRKIIANISSGAALQGYAGWSLYCAAKAGLENFVKSLALEQAQETQPFMVINISPGVMDTDGQALIRSTAVADFPDVQRFIDRAAAGGLRQPEAAATRIRDVMQRADLQSGGRYGID